MSVAEERLTSRKRSINLMPKSLNELCVSICVGSCVLVHASVLGTCLRAWMHVFRISSPVQLFKHILCSDSHRITHSSLLHEGGAAYGCLGGPPPPDLIPSPCRERRNASSERSGFFFSCSDGSKNVFGILYSFCFFSSMAV